MSQQHSLFLIFMITILSIIALVSMTFISLDNNTQNSITGNPIKELPEGKQHGFGGINRNALNPLPAKTVVALSDVIPTNPSLNTKGMNDCLCNTGQVLTVVTFHNTEQDMRGITLTCSKLQEDGILGIPLEKHCNIHKANIVEEEKTLSCAEGSYLYRTRSCLNKEQYIVGMEGWCMQAMIVDNKLTYKGSMLDPVSYADCATWSSWIGGKYTEPLVGFTFSADDTGFIAFSWDKVGLQSSLVS